jgi:hypothetical protein
MGTDVRAAQEGSGSEARPRSAGRPPGPLLPRRDCLSAYPEVLLVTRWQPWAGPGRGGIEHLAG